MTPDRNALVLDALPDIRRYAFALKRKLPKRYDLEDLVSAGVLGALQAAEAFDAALEVSFPHFANSRIRGAMLDYLRDEDHLTRRQRRRVKRGQDQDLKARQAPDDFLADRCVAPSPREPFSWDDGRDARRQLPLEDRVLLALLYVEGYSVKEVAELLGLHRRTVYDRLDRIESVLHAYRQALTAPTRN